MAFNGFEYHSPEPPALIFTKGAFFCCRVPLFRVSSNMINKVVFTKSAQKDLRKIDSRIIDKMEAWVNSVEKIGLEESF
jgi:hypothetical protein